MTYREAVQFIILMLKLQTVDDLRRSFNNLYEAWLEVAAGLWYGIKAAGAILRMVSVIMLPFISIPILAAYTRSAVNEGKLSEQDLAALTKAEWYKKMAQEAEAKGEYSEAKNYWDAYYRERKDADD